MSAGRTLPEAQPVVDIATSLDADGRVIFGSAGTPAARDQLLCEGRRTATDPFAGAANADKPLGERAVVHHPRIEVIAARLRRG